MSGITLPPIHNKRSPAQWEIISRHVDFRGKTVLDLGCGYADLLWRCWAAGAKRSVGVDTDLDIITHNQSLRGELATNPVFFYHQDIVEMVKRPDVGMGQPYDAILCFSVLPYLLDFLGTLKWIRNHSELALIEVQYVGDGPGIVIEDDDGMYVTLMEIIGWQSVTSIGTTYISDRDRHRTIWLCKDSSSDGISTRTQQDVHAVWR